MRTDLKISQLLVAAVFAVAAVTAHATPQTGYFIYDEAGHLIGEYDSNGNVIQEHIYLGDRPVAVVQGQSGSVGYVTTDQLNTPRAVTDASEAIEWSWTSDPFGNGQPTGSLTYNLRFPGQYYDAETGRNYNMLRDYDSSMGRYIESDPTGLGGGLNTYAYAADNPVRNSDPSGKNPLAAAATTVLVLGGPENPFADAAAVVVYAGSAVWAAYELSQVINNEEPCDREKQCEEQLETETGLCEAIAGPRHSGNSKQAVEICRKAAFQRFVQCMKGVPEPGRSPLTGVD